MPAIAEEVKDNITDREIFSRKYISRLLNIPDGELYCFASL